MKKALLFTAVVIVASFFTSCKKDNVCTCTTTYTPTGGAAVTGTPYVTTYTKSKKGDARAACLSSTSTDASGTYKSDCKLS